MNPNQESKQNELAQFAKDGLRDWVWVTTHGATHQRGRTLAPAL
jgi:hypothetical protein